ncbi:HDL332Wp [Eremothecium sinecaudum]|uniref:HDL332Wp n=1 Tax=Eremothecium sinecaudum TaxID=45286 RepID=A0A0X8HS15_9SACH|nr:HDL332Wp [Eremothecium sinecaudum]AMD20412.1 HDL332Wp [Eremothecium sinecaudum]
MGKKKVKNTLGLLPTGVPILEFKYEQPLFAIACHPDKPLIVAGMATGHMYCHQYDAAGLVKLLRANEKLYNSSENKDNQTVNLWETVDVPSKEEHYKTPSVELLWKCRRHKGSVRDICFESDGSCIYSIGTDNVLKKADTLTGKVVKKKTLSDDPKVKYTKMVKSSTHPFLLLGTESGNIEIYDSNKLELLNVVKNVHNGDGINDIFQYVGKSVYKYISLGQTTLASWDSRKPKEGEVSQPNDDKESRDNVFLSDDQEDEILCGTFVDPEDGEMLVCGMGEGVLTVWKPKKNNLMDQLTRIKIKKGESIDCIIPTLQADDSIWCGCSDGKVYKVNMKIGKCVEIRNHSESDEVAYLDLDYDYRLLSGGMDSVRLWDSSEKAPESGVHSEEVDGESNNSNSASSSDEELDSSAENDSGGSDSVASDSEEEGELVGLSREELIAELDKDLVVVESEEERNISNEKPPKKKRKQEQKNVNKKKAPLVDNHHHGINKFEGL